MLTFNSSTVITEGLMDSWQVFNLNMIMSMLPVVLLERSNVCDVYSKRAVRLWKLLVNTVHSKKDRVPLGSLESAQLRLGFLNGCIRLHQSNIV